jgi:hypothetical protein
MRPYPTLHYMKVVQKILILFCLFFSSPIFGQTKDDCSCLSNLEKIVSDIETNYPGYKLKTDTGSKIDYITNKRQSLSLASKTNDREKCFYIIERYLSFFKDNHIIFTDTKTNPGKTSVSHTLNTNRYKTKDSLVGVWTKSDGSLSIDIIKTNTNRYEGRIFQKNSKASEQKVYFELIGNYKGFRIRKHGNWLTTDLLRGRVLNDRLIEPEGVWFRNQGQAKIEKQRKSIDWNNRFRYKKLDSNIYYLGIPAFATEEAKFDSLIVNHIIPEINNNKIEHLIIDLRNNAGGNGSFFSLLRFTYEKPFSLSGDFLYASPSMIKKYTEQANRNSKRHIEMLPKLIANKGGFVQRDSLRIRIKEKLSYPQKVSIIVNDNCASSTEYFLILSKKSEKVKIYGRNTAGTLDYSELHTPENLPCKEYRYLRPTTKAFFADTYPIDNVGIKPDVDLSSYSEDNWIEIIQSDIKKTY